jgi:hypothetical protein
VVDEGDRGGAGGNLVVRRREAWGRRHREARRRLRPATASGALGAARGLARPPPWRDEGCGNGSRPSDPRERGCLADQRGVENGLGKSARREFASSLQAGPPARRFQVWPRQREIDAVSTSTDRASGRHGGNARAADSPRAPRSCACRLRSCVSRALSEGRFSQTLKAGRKEGLDTWPSFRGCPRADGRPAARAPRIGGSPPHSHH